MKNSLFSIIVASYNIGKYLPECLEALINHTYTNIEIIVIDDVSNNISLGNLRQYLLR